MVNRRDIITTPRVEEMRRQKKRKFFVRVFVIAIIVVILMIGLVFLSRVNKFLIHAISVSGTQVVSPVSIQGEVQQILTDYYVWVFPKSNTLLYPKQKIIHQLTKDFPRIKTIDIQKSDMNTIAIAITERNPSALWCGNVFPEPKETTCFFMDDEGFIFSEAPYFSGVIYFKWYGGYAGVDSPIGQHVFTSEDTSKLSLFTDAIREVGPKPYALVFKGDAVYELYIERSGDIGPKIIFKTSDDVSKTFQNFSSALLSDPMKSLFEKNFPDISYIDLRYENKIYYK